MGWPELAGIAVYLGLSVRIVTRRALTGRGDIPINLIGAAGLALLVYGVAKVL